MATERPTIIAHRGASVAHRENTVAAFAAAGPLGADAVELDARRTADGVIVVHHDDTLDDGRVIVELERPQLPPHVPTLAEALDACGGLVVNVEVKNWPEDADFDPGEAVTEAVVAELARRGRPDRYLVSSFHRPSIDRVRERAPGLATAFLHAQVDGATALAEAVAHGHRALHPWYGWVTEELIAAAHAQGVVVNTWTVDDPELMARFAGWGIDGIVTNVPDIALAALS
ncbi:MAG TPA: glycerophosphodiester phosphodiesterase [Acidimicrobiales bacterium]|nr:glycerophosphodiester phosphodiesterase [Acidimicrobiales bacterium]